MVCPKCHLQCRQLGQLGAGNSDVDYYDTAEIKICPKCETRYLEYYEIFEVSGQGMRHTGRVLDTIKNLIYKLLHPVYDEHPVDKHDLKNIDTSWI